MELSDKHLYSFNKSIKLKINNCKRLAMHSKIWQAKNKNSEFVVTMATTKNEIFTLNRNEHLI